MLAINSSNVIELNPLTNPLLDPIYVNDASVTITIFDSSGSELTGETWPQSLPYVTGSDGLYREAFSEFTDLIDGELYKIQFDVTGADTSTLQCFSTEKAGYKSCC